MAKEATYPMRINKYLASKNFCSRREADELINRHQVKINGKLAKLGDKIKEADVVEVGKHRQKKLVYLAYNKPKNIITHSPQGEEKEIADIFDYPEKVYPVGRLDKDSWGLIILTNDGRITGRLLEPERNHEKEYSVTVDKPVEERFVEKMRAGVRLDDGYKTKPCFVRKTGAKSFTIILTEGKKRQIRRMCSMFDYVVTNLKRSRILNVKLGSLQPGEYRKIAGQELEELFQAIGLGK